MFLGVHVAAALPPPHVTAEADTHSNVHIYQEREIERGSGVRVCMREGREGIDGLNSISKYQWPHGKIELFPPY